MKIAVIIPTRDRPKKFAQSINMMVETCANPQNLFFYVIIDSDDPQRHIYEKMLKEKNNIFLCIATPNQKTIYVNDMAEKAFRDGCDVCMTHADDVMFHKKTCDGWDIILQQKIEQIPDRICLCYFDDGTNADKLATHPTITRQWHQALGYFYPEIFRHGFGDTWIDDIARKVGRSIYIPEIKFEHQHFNQGYEMDETYSRTYRFGNFEHFNYSLYTPVREQHAKLLLHHIQNQQKQ